MKNFNALTDAQMDLYDRMSEISEERCCASWIADNEYDIWAAILSGATAADALMSPRLLKRCLSLSAEVGGWIYWADDHTDPALPREAWGARFTPMAQWLTMVEARRKLVAASQT